MTDENHVTEDEARQVRDFEARLDAYMRKTWGAHTPGDPIAATSAGLQSLAARGMTPLRLAEQALGGCLGALLALEDAVPADKMHSEALPLLNACGTMLSLARSELDTTLKSEALAYAASGDGPDAA